MFKYWGFGLHILSQIEFPELLPANFADADVTIEIGVVPEKIEGDGVSKRAFSYVSKDEYLLKLKNICKYYASHGNKIVVEPDANIDEKSVRLFLLGTIMAAILYQRGSIPMHASAVIKNGKLLIFTGNSGAGKSTLLAYLAGQGYDIFTDDICVMHNNLPGREGVFCTASYPMIKLWDDAIKGLENKQFTRDFIIRPQLPKYGQFFYDQFNSSSLPVDKIFILVAPSPVSQVKVKKLEPLQAFKILELQAYKHQLISGTKLRSLHFSLLSALSGNVTVHEVSRPASGTTVEQVYDAIKSLL